MLKALKSNRTYRDENETGKIMNKWIGPLDFSKPGFTPYPPSRPSPPFSTKTKISALYKNGFKHNFSVQSMNFGIVYGPNYRNTL